MVYDFLHTHKHNILIFAIQVMSFQQDTYLCSLVMVRW